MKRVILVGIVPGQTIDDVDVVRPITKRLKEMLIPGSVVCFPWLPKDKLLEVPGVLEFKINEYWINLEEYLLDQSCQIHYLESSELIKRVDALVDASIETIEQLIKLNYIVEIERYEEMVRVVNEIPDGTDIILVMPYGFAPNIFIGS